MPQQNNITIREGLLLLWNMTESAEELLRRYPRFNKYRPFLQSRHPRRQTEWLASRLLLDSINCRPEQVSYSPTGRPVIHHPDFNYISISHSTKLAGIYLHPSIPVGLDIESIHRNFAMVIPRFLSPEEQQTAASLPEGPALFWSIKEAVYKAAGKREINMGNAIHISNQSDRFKTTMQTDNEKITFEIEHCHFENQIIVCALKSESHLFFS